MIRKLYITVSSGLIAAGLFTGCGGDSVGPAGAVPDITTIYHKTVVPAHEDRLVLSDIEGSTYIFEVNGSIPEITRGSIIVGTEGGGYLRKVLSASFAGGKLIVETGQASLADAVIHGRTDTTISIGMGSLSIPEYGNTGKPGRMSPEYLAPGAALSNGGLDLTGLSLYSGEIQGIPSEITITEGRVGFNPTLDTGIKISCKRITEFHAIAEGTLEFRCSVKVDLGGEIDGPHEVPLATLKRGFVQFIGHVPVVGLVTLGFTAGFEFSGESVGDCQTGCESITGVSLGAVYSNGTWSGVNTIDSEFSSIPFECGDYADAEIKLYVKPYLIVSFYTMPAAYIECKPYLEFTADTATIPVWEWELYGGIMGEAGFHPEIMDDKFPHYSVPPLDYRTILDYGPFATDAFVFVTKWGSRGSGDYQFEYPRGIAVDAGENIYTVDNWNHRVQKFAPDSTSLGMWGDMGNGDGQFCFPGKAAVDAAGNVYVVDNENHRIQKFGQDGTFITKWGTEGGGDDQFKDPQGIAVDLHGNVYVTECYYHRIQKFTSDGDFISSWGGHGIDEGQMNRPMDIAVDHTGNVYVAECHNHRIQKFTPDGDFISMWGSHGDGDGQFNCPIAIAVDPDGDVYVVDYGNDRIQKLSPGGAFITKLGSGGNDDGQFDHPEGIAVSGDGNVYVVDSGNNRIQRFAPKNR